MTPSQQRKHKGCILVIDDGQASLNLLCTILTEDGYAVHERPLDLGSQLRFVKDTLPDLVLVDVRKPGTDGYQVCASLKSDPTTRAIPVIFISSMDRPMHWAKTAVSGAVDYVTAPFDAEEVLWRIETHIRLRCLEENLKSAVCNHGRAAGCAQRGRGEGVSRDTHPDPTNQQQTCGRKNASSRKGGEKG